MKRTVLSLAFLALVGAPAYAQGGALGTWEMKVESPQGVNTSTLVIKQEGDKLVGSVKSPRGERALDSVAVNGTDITMVLTIQFQGGDLVITYTGKVDGDSMTGEADFGGLASGPWSATRQAVEPAGATPDLTGTWDVTVEFSGGGGTPTVMLKQEGETLTGTYKGQLGESPLTGTAKSGDVAFSFKVNFQGQEFDVHYTGKVQPDGTLKGKVKLGDLGDGDWTAKKR